MKKLSYDEFITEKYESVDHEHVMGIMNIGNQYAIIDNGIAGVMYRDINDVISQVRDEIPVSSSDKFNKDVAAYLKRNKLSESKVDEAYDFDRMDEIVNKMHKRLFLKSANKLASDLVDDGYDIKDVRPYLMGLLEDDGI